VPIYPSSFLPSGGQTPVTSAADVLAEYPLRVQQEPIAPVRDAVVELQTEALLAYQDAASYAAAQSDPTRATGVYLEEFTNEVSIFRQDSEEDEALRTRLFSPPSVVTPQAIKAAVDALLAPVTDKQSVLWESVADRWFVSGTADWHSFVADGIADMRPDYPDRRYDLRSNSAPGGPAAFNESNGRMFVLRLPEIEAADGEGAFPRRPLDLHDTDRFYVNDGSGDWHGFAFSGGQSAHAIYGAIVNTVESIRGHGVRWLAFVDPKL
jgi:hypothetical protein